MKTYAFIFLLICAIAELAWFHDWKSFKYRESLEVIELREQNCRYRESLDRFTQYGKASYYAHDFHGKTTASGDTFNMNALTCASNYFPFGTRLRVSNKDKSVHVIVNDRGDFHKYGRILDLSYAAADSLRILKAGVVNVMIQVE